MLMLAYSKVKTDSGTFQFTFTFIILLSLLSLSKVRKNTRFNNWLPELAFVETNIFYLKTFESFFFFARKSLKCQKVNKANLLVEKTNWKNSTKLSYKPWTPRSNLNQLVHLLGALEGCSSTWAEAEWLFFPLTCEDIWFTAETYATGPADKWPLMQPCANCTEPCAGRLLKSCCCGGSRKRN